MKGELENIVFQIAKIDSNFVYCHSFEKSEILNSRIFITFKGINFIFCPTNKGNSGFQGLFIFVPFEQIDNCLTEDFKKTMRI